jgi:signal transduction histidine kinase
MVTDAQLADAESPVPTAGLKGARPDARRAARYVALSLALAAVYYAAGQASLALHYTGPVAVIWLPTGVGAAALYLAGLRWWPGLLIADLALADPAQPLATALGVTAGNMLDMVVIAMILRRLLGPRSRLDRLEQVSGMLVAIAAGAVVTATVAVLAIRAGGVLDPAELPGFWRRWFLADAAGTLVAMPLVLAWATGGSWALRGRAAWEGPVVMGAVVALSALALSGDLPLAYVVFPALIWAALRLGQRGATLSVAVAAGMTLWLSTHEFGAFAEHSITDAVLGTQLYIGVAALTTICLAAIMSDRERTALELAESLLREGRGAVAERERIARDLHDSVSQSLFSTVLHLRTAERELEREGVDRDGPASRELGRVRQLMSRALAEMRALVFELRAGAPGQDGLVVALDLHAAAVSAREELPIAVRGPDERLPLAPEAEEQLYRIGQEALANVVRHARATHAGIEVEAYDGTVVLRISDDGRGFDLATPRHGGFGVRSMVARASELGGRLDISGGPGGGTVVRVEIPAGHDA